MISSCLLKKLKLYITNDYYDMTTSFRCLKNYLINNFFFLILVKAFKKYCNNHCCVFQCVIWVSLYNQELMSSAKWREGASNCTNHLLSNHTYSKYGQKDGFKISVSKWVGNY